MTNIPHPIVVVCALFQRDGRILAAQRHPDMNCGGLWEFPGGKVEADESCAQALIREIREELACDIEVGDELAVSVHEQVSSTETQGIELRAFLCTIVTGEPQATEHAQIGWYTPEQALQMPWAPADQPLLLAFLAHLKTAG